MDAMTEHLIEHGFPCHQVGAETQREAGGSSRLNVYLKGRKLVNLSVMACSAGVTFSHRASSLGTLRL
jgi:hypothetical protein